MTSHKQPHLLLAGLAIACVGAEDVRDRGVGILVRGFLLRWNILGAETRTLLAQVREPENQMRSIAILEEQETDTLLAICNIVATLLHKENHRVAEASGLKSLWYG